MSNTFEAILRLGALPDPHAFIDLIAFWSFYRVYRNYCLISADIFAKSLAAREAADPGAYSEAWLLTIPGAFLRAHHFKEGAVPPAESLGIKTLIDPGLEDVLEPVLGEELFETCKTKINELRSRFWKIFAKKASASNWKHFWSRVEALGASSARRPAQRSPCGELCDFAESFSIYFK